MGLLVLSVTKMAQSTPCTLATNPTILIELCSDILSLNIRLQKHLLCKHLLQCLPDLSSRQKRAAFTVPKPDIQSMEGMVALQEIS